jgi:hypothetical protein
LYLQGIVSPSLLNHGGVGLARVLEVTQEHTKPHPPASKQPNIILRQGLSRTPSLAPAVPGNSEASQRAKVQEFCMRYWLACKQQAVRRSQPGHSRPWHL